LIIAGSKKTRYVPTPTGRRWRSPCNPHQIQPWRWHDATSSANDIRREFCTAYARLTYESLKLFENDLNAELKTSKCMSWSSRCAARTTVTAPAKKLTAKI